MRPSGYVSLDWGMKPQREFVDESGSYWLVFGDDPLRDSSGWPLDENMKRLPPDYERAGYSNKERE